MGRVDVVRGRRGERRRPMCLKDRGSMAKILLEAMIFCDGAILPAGEVAKLNLKS